MKKSRVLALTLAAVSVASVAGAAPQTQWNQGEWQLDLGAWSPEAKLAGHESDSKWNFNGGLGYALNDKWALRYDYHGLHTKGNSETAGIKTNGDEHEVNLAYSLGKNWAVFGGWHRINNDFKGGLLGDNDHFNKNNNIAQLGVVTNYEIAPNLHFYAEGALGTKKTSLWESGLSYTIAKDWDINAGYRYVDTEYNDDNNIKYRGFIAGLTYRFGGHHEEAPAPAPVEPVYVPPVQQEVVPEHVYNDYYLDTIHFGYDEDQPLASEAGKLAHFVQVARDNPDSTFKLVGNTDGDGSNAYNEDLSKRRVDSVAAYANRNGVSDSRMQLNYKGETNPVADNSTDQGKADNRRVDIWEHK